MRFITICFCFLSFGTTAFTQSKTDPAAKKINKKKALHFMVFGDWGRNGEDNQKETAWELGIDAKTFKPEFIVSTGDNFYPNGVRSTRDHYWLASFEDIYTAMAVSKLWKQ
jgi:tartrate-resistant acid phosphatase type 5